MDEKLKEILEMITNKGFKAYVVGGYVRDYLRKIKTNDIDICTNARVKDLMEIFKDYKVTPLEYGNILLETKDYLYEITTFRKDIDYINNRKPIIEYVDTLEEDITRRDFTVNSICMDKDGKIIDLLNGKKDLNKKIIRTIGDPYFKIKQDSLRILRAIRFASIYDFRLDDNLVSSIIKYRDRLKYISFDRIKNELNIIFRHNKASNAFELIDDLKLNKVLKISHKNMIIDCDNYIGVWAQILYSDDYNFSKKEMNEISIIKSIIEKGYIDDYMLYKYDFNIIRASSLVLNLDIDYKTRYNNLPIHNRKDIDIDSYDIMKLTSKENIDKIYVDLEKQILYNKLKNEKSILIEYIMNNYRN